MRRLPRLVSAVLFAVGLACSPAQLVGPPPQDDAGEYDAPFVSDGSLPATNAVTILVEPGDKGAGILAAIKGATKSIHMTMYLLTNDTIVDALISQHKAGRDVKIILNQTFPQGAGTDNAPDYAKLKAAGVPVIWASSQFNYTHEKCVILDGTIAWIMTMNLTFTSPTDNREFLAVDTDPNDVAEAEAVFSADFTGQTPTLTGRLVVAPVNAHEKLLRLVNEAQTTLDVEGESFSDQAMEDALITAKQRGLAVRIVVSDQSPSTAMAKALSDMKGAGILVKKLSVPYIHSKAIVADGVRAYVGSENFTQNSLDNNRELGLIVADATAVKVLCDTIAKDFAAGVNY
ncbi:hypothetical protein BH09MYX1_BH09MYX1_14190 [soil metagenome]